MGQMRNNFHLMPVIIILTIDIIIILISAATGRYYATILTIEVRESDYDFDLSRVGPAIRLALTRSRELYNETMGLFWQYRPGSCGPYGMAAEAAYAYYNFNFEVFIGPACSVAVSAIGYLANSWNLPIITPIGKMEHIGNKWQFPLITRMSGELQIQFVEMALHLMRRYNWTHLAIITDTSSREHYFLSKTFDMLLEKQNKVKSAKYVFEGIDMTRTKYRDLLTGARSKARVIVILMSGATLREFMLVAHDLGYTSGDFVFIARVTEYYLNGNKLWKRNDSEDQAAKQAFECVILPSFDPIKSKAVDDFNEQMIKDSLEMYRFDYRKYGKKPTVDVLKYYDSVMLYAQVLNETLAEGEDPRDGLAMTQRMWNRTFKGLAGPIVINENGDRVGDMTIWDLDPTTGDVEIVFNFPSSTHEFQSQMSRSIWWPNNRGPPPDEPICGFSGDKCQDSSNQRGLIAALVTALGAVVLLSLIAIPFLYRRWRRLNMDRLWWWKIPSTDLILSRPCGESSGPSVMSGVIIGHHSSEHMSTTTLAANTALHKGQKVRIRTLLIDAPIVNYDVLHEFRLIHEAVTPYLVRVVGACLDQTPAVLVTELCQKGRLQDVLYTTRLALDLEFKISIANDIIQGLRYLHSSPIGHHGRLSSAVCLIDNRFTVKLADYGMDSLFNQERVDESCEEYQQSCLYEAPELLRRETPTSMTKQADIYSFGIILSEVITRKPPFAREMNLFSLDEIFLKLKEGDSQHGCFRPIVECSGSRKGFWEIMVLSWHEDPHLRPTAECLKKRIDTLAQKYGHSSNLLDNLLKRMERYANNLEKVVEEKTTELEEEKKKSEELLYQILPRNIADLLKQGSTVEPEQYDCVTVGFSDIVGFTALSSNSTPFQVVDLLNDMYSAFDETLVNFDVYKVETIGDAYMMVSGLPNRNGNLHAQEMALMSLELLELISTIPIRHLPGEKLELKIGLNSGPVCAGVVGAKMPRYCLFGNTVNTASRMESTSARMKIHMSETTAEILESFGTFVIEERGPIDIKGKGKMTTYWLIGKKPKESG